VKRTKKTPLPLTTTKKKGWLICALPANEIPFSSHLRPCLWPWQSSETTLLGLVTVTDLLDAPLITSLFQFLFFTTPLPSHPARPWGGL